jgi:TolB protein
MMPDNENHQPQDKPQETQWQSYLILITIALILIITAVVFYPNARQKMLDRPTTTPELTSAISSEVLETPTPLSNPTEIVTYSTPTPDVYAQTSQFGSLVLSLREGKDIHLFLYRPFLENTSTYDLSAFPLTRITTGPQQDITPALSPDGSKIAFASNRDGQWDIYILDLVSGETLQFTDTRAYDGNPTWSPDGLWLAYESLQLDNLDIFIQDIAKTSGPLPLTNNSSADFSPNWSGEGRKIGYVSNRNGQLEIWYADLDSSEPDKSIRVPGSTGQVVDHPTWSSDGRYLTWFAITNDGQHSLFTWDSASSDLLPKYSGQGDWPIWAGNGEILFTAVITPDESYLTAYPGLQENSQVMLPAIKLPGSLEGISWARDLIINPTIVVDQEVSPVSLWEDLSYTNGQEIPQEDLVQVQNLIAPSPKLIKPAADAFVSLRRNIREEIGWDFLSTLEYAFVPLDEALEPGINFNWLHAGRGVLINDIPRLAEWLMVVQEDYGENTYWRVYLRTNNQQGLQGKPLKRYPWDFSARHSGSK